MSTLTISSADWELLEDVEEEAISLLELTSSLIRVKVDLGDGRFAGFHITGDWIGADLDSLSGVVSGIRLDIDGVTQFDATGLAIDAEEIGEEVLKDLDDVIELALGDEVDAVGSDDDDTLSCTDGDDSVDGRDGDDHLYGELGDDRLSGGRGHDSLDGGIGNDSLVGGGGNDDLVCGAGSDLVTGGAGTDSLNGGGGHDDVRGGIGNDSLAGAGGDDELLAGDGDDRLTGGSGSDVLEGGKGHDVLAGGSGADDFLFDCLSRLDNDRIVDFSIAEDTIQLDTGVFTAFSGATGGIGAGNFVANATGTAQDANDFLVYETDTGKLFYDADGSGSGAAVQIALVGTDLGLTSAHFQLV
ncbi:MAG: hypothetical protein K0R58_2743 [Ramlibacter sp.]|jgi:Ca2+-binding RTX toxin-like protein|nr:hypothetical protein [Ramlibacter sp.]